MDLIKQVAEMEEEGEKKIVGMVRGCIKTVSCGRKLFRNGSSNDDGEDDSTKIITPIYAKVASILGLRVCPSHRYFILFSFLPSISGIHIG